MLRNVQIFLSIIVIVVIYSPYTYGPNRQVEPLWNSSPEVPDSGKLKICKEWLLYHSASQFDNLMNKNRAIIRRKEFDVEVHVWAATYAYFISSFYFYCTDREEYSIEYFCKRFVPVNVLTPYLSLQNAKMTCGDWIYSYGYDREHMVLNRILAVNRLKDNDRDAHIFVAMYSRYLEKYIDRANETPLQFCELLENALEPENKDMPFMNLETTMLCKEWIEFSGYSREDEEFNLSKALRQHPDIQEYLNLWAFKYINYLHAFNRENRIGCCPAIINRKPKNPEDFCLKISDVMNDFRVRYTRDLS